LKQIAYFILPANGKLLLLGYCVTINVEVRSVDLFC
jgi:hypothetical protein